LVVRRVVGVQLVRLAFERERRVRDPVRDAADDRAEVRALGDVVVDLVEPEHDVAQLAGLVRHVQLGDDGAVVGDLGEGALRVGQRVDVDRLAVDGAVARLLDPGLARLLGLFLFGLGGLHG
jgi:hypothetical protein